MSAKSIEIKGDKASAAGGGPNPNHNPNPNPNPKLDKNKFEDDDLVWVQDENNKNWFPGLITEQNKDNTYDIQFNQESHPDVAIDRITDFELDLGNDVIVLNEEEDKFSNDNFKNGKISGVKLDTINEKNIDKEDKYDVTYHDNTTEQNIQLGHLAETDAQMLLNKMKNEVLTTIGIFSRNGAVYKKIDELFRENKLDPPNHSYKTSDIFDTTKFNDLDFVLTGLFNATTPVIPAAIELNANNNITFFDLAMWVFVPQKKIDADDAFLENIEQVGKDLPRNHVMTLMNGENIIDTSSKYIVPGEQDTYKNVSVYKKFLTHELNKDTSFSNNIERTDYINFLLYLVAQTVIASVRIFNYTTAFDFHSEPTVKPFFYDVTTKIATFEAIFDLVSVNLDNQYNPLKPIGNIVVKAIFDLTNFSQSKIVFTPFFKDIPKGDYLFPPITDITFDSSNLLNSKIEFTPPTTDEQIFPPNLVTSMINKIQNVPTDYIGFNSALDNWLRPQIADKLNKILEGKLSLSLTNILTLQKTVTCLTEETNNIYLLNYSTLNALVGIKENYTAHDLNTLWLNLDRDIHGVPIYFNDIKYKLYNNELGNTDKKHADEIINLYNFISSNYSDINGYGMYPNSLCQILLLTSQSVGNAIRQALSILLEKIDNGEKAMLVSISPNLLGNTVKKQFGIIGNNIVIRSEKGKGENELTGYIVRPRLKLINTLYFLLYTDHGTPFAVVEIKINIDIVQDEFNVEYKTISFFKYYDVMKGFYFGELDYKEFPPTPNGSGTLSVYKDNKLEPVLTIKSDNWQDGILAKGVEVIITDNRLSNVSETNENEEKGGSTIQVGGGKSYRTVLTEHLDPNTINSENFMTRIDLDIKKYENQITKITEGRADVKAVEDAVKKGNYLRADNRLGNKSHQGIVLFSLPNTSNATNYVYIGPILPNGDKNVFISKKYGKILRFSTTDLTNEKTDKKYTVLIKPGKENSSDWDQFVLKPNFSKNYSNKTELPLEWSMVRFGSVYDNLKFSLTNNSLDNGIARASELVTRVFRDLMVDPIANDLSLTKGLFEDTDRVFKMEKMIYIQVLIYFKILFALLKRYDINLITIEGYVSMKPLLNKLYGDYEDFTEFNEDVSDEYKYTTTDSADTSAADNIDEELNTAPVSTLLWPIISSMDPKTNTSVFEPINQQIANPTLLPVYVLKAALLVLQNLGIVLQMYMSILGRMPVDDDANMVANYNPFALYPMYQKIQNVYNHLYQFYNGLSKDKINDNVIISNTLTKHNSATINKYLVSLALRIGASSSLMSYGGYKSRKNKDKSYKHKFSKRISKATTKAKAKTRNHRGSKREREYTRKL